MMLTQERLRELLNYDPETGLFTWRIAPCGRVKIGAEAGAVNARGYVEVGVAKKVYKAHRLAWFYTYGVWPRAMLDHRNRTRSDNRFANLREATNAQNKQNSQLARADNECGLIGVSARKNGHFVARIQIPGGTRKHLGTFTTKELANEIYLLAKEMVHPFSVTQGDLT
jgi:hypothetical protein